MQEENKEAKPQDAKPAAEAKPAEIKPQEQAPQAKAPEKKEAEAAKKEKPANCAACNKSIKKKRHYYRDGKYFCTKRCWKATIKKEAKPEEAPKN